VNSSEAACGDYRKGGNRRGYGLGIYYTVPTCECGADRADHEEDDHPIRAGWDNAGHDAEYGHCARCGVSLIESFGADGSLIAALGWCNACQVTTSWGIVDVG
jgi:hypothetical protein